MRLETIPLIIGVLIACIGAGIVFDAWTPDEIVIPRERRRRPRVERHRGGEALIGFGVIGVAAEFLGRDNWNYSTYAVIAGVILLVWGAALEWRYVAASITNRGKLRRREPGAGALPPSEPPAELPPAERPHAERTPAELPSAELPSESMRATEPPLAGPPAAGPLPRVSSAHGPQAPPRTGDDDPGGAPER